MSEPTLGPEYKLWFFSKWFLIFLVITDICGWSIVLAQNSTIVGGILQKMPWLPWVFGGVVTLYVMYVVILWVFKKQDRRSQLLRMILPCMIFLISLGVFLIIHNLTASTSSTSPDNLGNASSAAFLIITAITGFLTLVAAVIAVVPRPEIPPQPVIICCTSNKLEMQYEQWMQMQLEHERYNTRLEVCDNWPISEVLSKIRQHVAQGEHVVLLLSPDHPLIQHFNRIWRFLLCWEQVYYQNMSGKGAFILAYTEPCPLDKQKALLLFNPIDFEREGEDEGKALLLKRVRAMQRK